MPVAIVDTSVWNDLFNGVKMIPCFVKSYSDSESEFFA